MMCISQLRRRLRCFATSRDELHGMCSLRIASPAINYLIRIIAAAWNADTQQRTHGSRGLLVVRGAQSGNPKRSGHYLTVRR